MAAEDEAFRKALHVELLRLDAISRATKERIKAVRAVLGPDADRTRRYCTSAEHAVRRSRWLLEREVDGLRKRLREGNRLSDAAALDPPPRPRPPRGERNYETRRELEAWKRMRLAWLGSEKERLDRAVSTMCGEDDALNTLLGVEDKNAPSG